GLALVSPITLPTAANNYTSIFTITLGGSLVGFSQQPSGSGPNVEPITAAIVTGAPPLALTSEVQTVNLTGATAGAKGFTLPFHGFTTPAITYTGTAVDATNIANALNALNSIGGVSGSVTVTQVSPGVYNVSFGGNLATFTTGTTGFNQPQITGAI